VIPVTGSDLGTRATAAFAAGDLPDVIYHTLQYALPWYEAGILDADAATEVVENLGADTFAPGALAMAAVDEGWRSRFVPVDGWTQMIVYRKPTCSTRPGWSRRQPTPTAGRLEALHNPPEMFGFVAATKVDENFMSQVLEHVFLANGVSPVGPDGFQPLDEGSDDRGAGILQAPSCRGLARGGTVLAAVARALFRGARGDDHLVALHPRRAGRPARQRAADDQRRSDLPELASKTDIVTNFAGPSNPDGAAWADVRYFGVTADANTDAAMEFVEFSMDDGYTRRCRSRRKASSRSARHGGRSDRVHRWLGHAARRRRPQGAAVRSLSGRR
jgi:multiple sugar transport system substrate-binding protein